MYLIINETLLDYKRVGNIYSASKNQEHLYTLNAIICLIRGIKNVKLKLGAFL